MNIILHEPEIPQNTGNIARTCLITNTTLHLIRPLGFKIDEKTLIRAGLDYLKDVDIRIYDNFEHFLEKNENPIVYMSTTKAKNLYTDVKYPENAFIMFGKESKGIPEEILVNNKDTAIRIPMIEGARSLNLSSSVAIVIYEALRQLGFKNMQTQGNLTKFNWN
ncbi:MAG: tRNA (cytidine(34)-2'-O)-methyltransferase [Defluviitaleaceae bacterium]|nr:tRNA (cytidine(34)-2'-O)-methyltransferase [Defluviitaleaceae bacterium]